MHQQGTRRVIKYFMGEVMKRTKGRAQPELLTTIFNELLGPYGRLPKHHSAETRQPQ
jgi:Asp-tRNA(Asn)/Glu-tRNA(Gln) amidotransferase B subunit